MSVKSLGCAGAVLLSFCVGATDYYVAESGSGDYTSGNPGGDPLYAVNTLAVASGDVVYVGPGTYSLTGTMSPKDGVDVIGTSGNRDDTILVGNGSVRVMYAAGRSNIRNLTLRNGVTQWQGGGINGERHAGGSPGNWNKTFVISNCVVENCKAKYQGGGGNCGIWYDCIVRNCSTTGEGTGPSNQEACGGGVYGGKLYRCVITGNVSKVRGGGVSGGGTEKYIIDHRSNLWQMEAHDCEIAYNTAFAGAGAGVYDGTACRLFNCRIHDNVSTWQGGGAFVAQVTDCIISSNTAATYGGGVAYSPVSGGQILTNVANSAGGGIYCAQATNCTIRGNAVTKANSDTKGGGGALGSRLVDCRVLDNTSNYWGGGTLGGTNVLCTFEGNAASIGGGGFLSVFDRCLLKGNESKYNQGGAGYNCETYNCLVISNMTYNNGTLCRGYHQGDLLIDNKFGTTGGYDGCGKEFDGTTQDNNRCVAVNCTVVLSEGATDWTSAKCPAIASTAITNVLVCGFTADVGNLLGASHSFWKTGTGPSGADACITTGEPQFVGTEEVTLNGRKIGQWSLKPTSVCVGKGLNLPWMEGAVDILGNARLFRYNTTVDIGACECFWNAGTTIMIK